MRLFIAAELPELLLETLSETSALLRDQVHGRYVAPDSFHMTMAFLGEVAGSGIAEVCAAIDEACAGQPPIGVTLGPLGSFGKSRRGTLWQGLARGVDELAGLAGDIRECLAERDLSYDSSLFVPHVTLMRAADLSAGVLPMPLVEKGVIDTITLFESDLSGSRPRYEALYRAHLQDDCDSLEADVADE